MKFNNLPKGYITRKWLSLHEKPHLSNSDFYFKCYGEDLWEGSEACAKECSLENRDLLGLGATTIGVLEEANSECQAEMDMIWRGQMGVIFGIKCPQSS